MSPSRGQKGDKQYCYYVTRFKPSEDKSTICRLPAGEVDKLVLEALCEMLKTSPQPKDDDCKVQWHHDVKESAELATSVFGLPRHEQKALLIQYAAQVHVKDASIEVTFTANGVAITNEIPAKMVRRGNELRLALPPDHITSGDYLVDQTLVRLIAQGFAAREHLIAGKYAQLMGAYDRKHLLRLARVAWLAPDIISTILDGKQPVQLTARHILRCADIPMEWQEQRSFLGFC